MWKYKQWCSVSFHSKWFMLGDFNNFVLPSDMRSIKMSQLQLCTYHLFHFTLSFGEVEDQMYSQGMGWVCYYWHTHGRHFIHSLLDLQPFEVSRQTSVDSSGVGSSSQRADKCYLVLVNSKKKKKKRKASVSYKKQLLMSGKKFSTSNFFKAWKSSRNTNIYNTIIREE